MKFKAFKDIDLAQSVLQISAIIPLCLYIWLFYNTMPLADAACFLVVSVANFSPKTSYPDRFSSWPSCRCLDNSLKQAMTTSFHILLTS